MITGVIYMLLGSGISMGVAQFFLNIFIRSEHLNKDAVLIAGCLILYIFNIFQLYFMAAEYI